MRLVKVLVLAAFVLVTPRIASAMPISGNGVLGDFTGAFDYSYDSNTFLGKLVISLTNTSAASNGGYITALAFNNPNDKIDTVSFESDQSYFGLLGMPDFTNEFGVSPFGSSDIGASVTNQWLGGGSPTSGIGVGQKATFTFQFTGDDLGTLTNASFVNALSTGGGGGAEWLLVRFRGFENGGSDKVPGVPGRSVPEPASIVLLGSGLAMIAARKKLRRG
jgi:hypothetical protein